MRPNESYVTARRHARSSSLVWRSAINSGALFSSIPPHSRCLSGRESENTEMMKTLKGYKKVAECVVC
ncbi:hypothetical protein F2P79_019095 [Pimephales promelas]|nr:hypothetical protein F2P79_019095 [Pimephales promelas]